MSAAPPTTAPASTAVPWRRLARTAVALRWALLRGTLRGGPGSTSRRIGLGLGVLTGAMLAVIALVGLAASRGRGDLPTDLCMLLFTGLVAGWVVLPIATFASDDLMDPSRLALLPLSRRQLLTVMGCGALVGVAPSATTVAALGLLPATAHSPTSVLVGLVCVALLLAMCVGASRATAAALSGLLRSRRGRDLGVVLAAMAGLSVQLVNPAIQVLSRRTIEDGASVSDAVHDAAQWLRWTPTGLLAAAPGRPLGPAAASLLAGAGVLAVLLLVWERSVRRALERAEASTQRGRTRRRTNLAPRLVPLPAGRTGAVTAKDLRYLVREPRRLTATIASLLLPALVVIGPLVAGGDGLPDGTVYAVCGVGLLGWVNSANRFGLDGTATWVLVASWTDRRDARRDLLGGDLAVLVVTVPTMVLLAAALAAVTGGWRHAPGALGIGVALLLVGLGLACLLGVLMPYPVPPTQNAFSGGGSGQQLVGAMFLLAALLGTAVLCLPLLALLIPSARGSVAAGAALLAVGPAYGAAVATGLRRIAATHWEQRGPQVLQVLASV